NDDWESKTPLSNDRLDDVNQIYEATLGGPFWKDKIWFFASFRDKAETGTDQTDTTNLTVPTTDDETRLEGKLTVTPHPSHQLQASFLDLERTRAGTGFGPVRKVDLASFNDNRLDPQEIKSANYTGILTSSLFVEAQYSERDFQLGIGSGGPRDLINGTFIRSQGGDAGRVQYNSPFFCGECETELRNNENTLVKGSYFLTTENAGTHDIAFGYDTFTDIRFSVNHQTGSDFQVWSQTILITGDANNTIYPVLDSNSWLVWWPPTNLDIAAPTDFTTNSFYINDSWQLNDKWSFNIGVRYDENDGVDSGGVTTVDDNKVSPRVGFSYDVKGDGDLIINGSYGTYVAAIANTRADETSQGGQLAGLGFFYGGPDINTNCQANGFVGCTDTETALNTIFDWYFANGGTDDVNVAQGNIAALPNLIFACFPGVTNVVPDTLRSPAADEFTIGATKRLGSKGLLRADLIYREWEDFYANSTQLGLNVPELQTDIELVGNFGEPPLERDYLGINVSGRYRLTDRFTLSGNYTWSELEGNINGETAGAGPTPLSPNAFPEYKDPAWNVPVGPLLSDQTHKLRVWGIYDIIENERNSLSFSVLQNFFSGTPYSASGLINNQSFVNNPGYLDPPDNVTYFFSERGAFESDDITRTDISLNYSFRWNAFGKSLEIFVQPEIINLFNEDGVEVPGTDINTEDNTAGNSCNGAPCQLFNPFTETPIEGVHWSRGTNFGQATEEDDFQQPRTFRFSVGFRF
ncbi:MAG: TonB-dependent receptor, partial [Acidobacteriota bacterium]